ncbi:hypothetical protein BX600DRAFT_451567 [Xylariales sp. PMI_506]|nr:hypothetical protein BX600DRAFT_451567 [Xylariales sp. PMI_506]
METGNVQNWAEVLERDFLVLEDTMRRVRRGQRRDRRRSRRTTTTTGKEEVSGGDNNNNNNNIDDHHVSGSDGSEDEDDRSSCSCSDCGSGSWTGSGSLSGTGSATGSRRGSFVVNPVPGLPLSSESREDVLGSRLEDVVVATAPADAATTTDGPTAMDLDTVQEKGQQAPPMLEKSSDPAAPAGESSSLGDREGMFARVEDSSIAIQIREAMSTRVDEEDDVTEMGPTVPELCIPTPGSLHGRSEGLAVTAEAVNDLNDAGGVVDHAAMDLDEYSGAAISDTQKGKEVEHAIQQQSHEQDPAPPKETIGAPAHDLDNRMDIDGSVT